MKLGLYKKTLVSGILVLFVGINFIPLIGNILGMHYVLQDTVYVDDDFNESTPGWGFDHFDNIQDGINAVGVNGSVYVYDGIYYENINIGKSLSLIGNSSTTVTIEGSGVNNTVVTVTSNEVTISGFTITNGSSQGITLSGSKYCIISENNILNNRGAITLGISPYNTIKENNIINNEGGIGLAIWSNENIIEKNNFKNNNMHAFFFLSALNKWKKNYWDRPRILPKPIFGLNGIVPWINFDFRPAQTPYEIP
jgi:parallel beta-helix repeat protein